MDEVISVGSQVSAFSQYRFLSVINPLVFLASPYGIFMSCLPDIDVLYYSGSPILNSALSFPRISVTTSFPV